MIKQIFIPYRVFFFIFTFLFLFNTSVLIELWWKLNFLSYLKEISPSKSIMFLSAVCLSKRDFQTYLYMVVIGKKSSYTVNKIFSRFKIIT